MMSSFDAPDASRPMISVSANTTHMLLIGAGEGLSMLARDIWRVEVKMTSLDNTIDVYISRLRDRLKQAGCTGRILTKRGIGFMFVKDEAP